MKCQHCGNHEATFHYSSNINGELTERHLCGACAAAMESSVFARTGEQAMRAPIDNMANVFFNDFWSLPFYGWRAPGAGPAGAAGIQEAPADRGPEIPVDAGADIKRRRQLSALRHAQKAAVKSENFERAAEIRDELYRLEKDQSTD